MVFRCSLFKQQLACPSVTHKTIPAA